MALAIISYPFNAGGAITDRWMWMATINGKVYDYQTKDKLKADLKADGHSWQVIRRHRNGTDSAVECGS